MRRLWSDLGLIKMFEPSVNLWIQSPVLLSLLLLKKHVLIWHSSRITTRHWLDFMSKPVIKITLRKIFRCSNDFSWLMTGQTHLLYSDLPKAPGLPQGLSTDRIIGKIYTTHKLIIHQRKWSAKSLYICILINAMSHDYLQDFHLINKKTKGKKIWKRW